MEKSFNFYQKSTAPSKNHFCEDSLIEILWEGSWIESRIISIQGEKVKVRLSEPVLFDKKSVFQKRSFFGEEKILRKKSSDEFRIFEMVLEVNSIRLSKSSNQTP